MRFEAVKLAVEADEQIEGGTSGGPIIRDEGELAAIVSIFSQVAEEQQKFDGLAPRPHMGLPLWICNQIFRRKLTTA